MCILQYWEDRKEIIQDEVHKGEKHLENPKNRGLSLLATSLTATGRGFLYNIKAGSRGNYEPALSLKGEVIAPT